MARLQRWPPTGGVSIVNDEDMECQAAVRGRVLFAGASNLVDPLGKEAIVWRS